MENTHELYERFFVQEVTNMARERGLSHSEFGRRLFGEEGSRMWRTVRDPMNTRKPRRVSLGEVHKVAEILDVELPSLIWAISQKFDAEQKLRKE